MPTIYTSAFLGVPLPGQYQSEFELLLNKLHAIDANLDMVNLRTPHITVQFLDRQPRQNLEAIANTIKPHLPLLGGLSVTVRSMGLFNPNAPRVLFLEVEYPNALTDFHRLIGKSIAPYIDNSKADSFHPHLTLARLRTKSARDSFDHKRPEIAEILRHMSWTFALTEITLYGVDAGKPSDGQQKLIVMQLGNGQ